MKLIFHKDLGVKQIVSDEEAENILTSQKKGKEKVVLVGDAYDNLKSNPIAVEKHRIFQDKYNKETAKRKAKQSAEVIKTEKKAKQRRIAIAKQRAEAENKKKEAKNG
jgi:hypothetical protein